MDIGRIGINCTQNFATKSLIQQNPLTEKTPADSFTKTTTENCLYDKNKISSLTSSVTNKTSEISSQKLLQTSQESSSKVATSMLTAPQGAALSTIKIIYTNDIHGGILPITDEKKPGLEIGGMSYLSSMIKETAGDKSSSLLLDGGDWAQGTFISGYDKGKTLMKMMSEIGYDATVIGNHDFDWGRPALNDMISTAKFPVLGANILDKNGQIMNGTQPYIIKEIDGTKIGIIGVTSPRTAGDTGAENTKGLTFEDPAKIIKKYMPEMKKQGVEMFVAISHCGDSLDKKLAQSVPELDVIVGAHSHKVFDQPLQIGNTLIVQAGSGAKNMGELEIKFDRETDTIAHFTNNIKQANSNTSKKDPSIEAILEPLMNEVGDELNKVLGETSITLTRRGKNAETIMGNIITDGMRAATGADVAFTNSGGIRAEIKPGPITFGEAYLVLPSENTLVTMELTGKQLKGVMEESAGRSRGTIEVSGMKMDIEPKNPAGKKAMNIMVNGMSLDEKKIYKVVTTDFLAGGSNGYDDLTQGRNVNDTKILYRDSLVNYIQQQGSFNEFNARVEGRQNYLSPKPSFKKTVKQ